MVTNEMFYAKYGDPATPDFTNKWLKVWKVPIELQKGKIPAKIYCNIDLIPVLLKAFKNLVERGYWSQLKTWDGCFNIRPIRGYEQQYKQAVKADDMKKAIKYLSVHSWADAIDVNQAENGLGTKGKLTPEFVKCFTDAGFDWGGTWKRSDPMHFQLAKI